MELSLHEAQVILSVVGGKQVWERDGLETLDAVEARQEASRPLVTRGACQYAKATEHGLKVARERLADNLRKRGKVDRFTRPVRQLQTCGGR